MATVFASQRRSGWPVNLIWLGIQTVRVCTQVYLDLGGYEKGEAKMKFAKRLLIVAGAVALAGLLSVMLVPKAVHAVVSTLVTVANTSSNSVPIGDGGFAEEPFQWEGVVRASNSYSSLFTNFVTPSVTVDGRTVRRLVIEDVTADCQGLSSPASGIRVSSGPGFSQAGAALLPSGNAEFFVPLAAPIGNEQDLSQETRIYVDPGVTVQFNALTFTTSGACAYSAYGHFVVQ